MEPIKISTPDEAMAALIVAARVKGMDFVYNEDGTNSCHYFETDGGEILTDGADPKDLKPGCIIGQMLADAGFDPVAEPKLAKAIEGVDVRTLTKADPYKRWPEPLIDAPPVVVEMLAQAQTAQDEGQSWREALRVARAIKRGAELAQANA